MSRRRLGPRQTPAPTRRHLRLWISRACIADMKNIHVRAYLISGLRHGFGCRFQRLRFCRAGANAVLTVSGTISISIQMPPALCCCWRWPAPPSAPAHFRFPLHPWRHPSPSPLPNFSLMANLALLTLAHARISTICSPQPPRQLLPAVIDPSTGVTRYRPPPLCRCCFALLRVRDEVPAMPPSADAARRQRLSPRQRPKNVAPLRPD